MHVDLAGASPGPPARRDRRAHDLLLRAGENIGDIEMPGDVDVHASRDVRLRIEVDHERAQTPGESGGGQPQRHRGLCPRPP